MLEIFEEVGGDIPDYFSSDDGPILNAGLVAL